MVFGRKLPFINFNGQSKAAQVNNEPAPPPIPSNHRGAGMDFERWVIQQMDLLKMRSMTSDRMLSGVQLPPRLAEKIFKVDVNEKNGKGETLMIAVVLYIVDDLKQVKFLNLLLRMGADPNLVDSKHQRTPVMFACLHKKIAAVRVLVNWDEINLSLRDRLGNTALSYAALRGDQIIIDLVSTRLAKTWSFDVFLNKNQNGNTAESMATWGGKLQGAALLRTRRLRMLQRMHKQLALINHSAKLKGWKGYSEAFYAVKLWRSKLRRRRHTVSMPDLVDLEDHPLMAEMNNGDHRPRSGREVRHSMVRALHDNRRAKSSMY